jgi:hypothetical protein
VRRRALLVSAASGVHVLTDGTVESDISGTNARRSPPERTSS